ncbi:unnamed protein product [Blepharisma stoltei]|uniref:Kinesin light chain n=1 Tax=Blepharisma stoltei TaxID=1481888 RepID=A0AAU9KEW0_9CILI|nr:unnamed protein product [Blepharisma stoltei]
MNENATELEATVLNCNRLAMDYLKLEDFKQSLTLLKRAETILNNEEDTFSSIPNRLKLMGITLNNLGCYYKKRKQIKVALNYLRQALQVELQTQSDNVNIAGTHLNICAILSSLSKHEQSFQHARQAMALLEEARSQEALSQEKGLNLATSLVISYHNAGAELEHMSKMSEALQYYESAWKISKKELGGKNPLTVNMLEAFNNLSMKFNNSFSVLRSERNRITPLRTRGSASDVPNTVREKLPSITPPRMRNGRNTGNSISPGRDFRVPETIEKIRSMVSRAH